MYSAIGSLKEYFAGQKSSGLLSEKEVRLLDVHFMDFIGSAFPFFNYSQSKDILSTMPDRLQEFRDKTPKDAPYRKLLDQLYVVDANNYSDIKRIEYYITGKRPEDTQRIKAAWGRMLIDPNPEVKKMAWDLIKYTFFANGYGFGPYSFANLVPVLFWTNEYQIKEGIVDESNRPFNDFLAAGLKQDKLAKEESAWRNRFINQFIRNNGTKEGFVKTVKLDNKIFDANDLAEDVNKLNSSMGKAAREAMGGIIKTNFRGYVAVNQSKNTDLQTTNRTPARFIKTSLGKGKFQLYELEDTKEFSDAPWANMAIYKPISNLGISNFILEYDFTKDIENSHIASIKQSANPAVKQGSTMEDIEAQIMAEAQASMMADMDASFMSEIMNENPALTTMGASIISPTVAPITQPTTTNTINIYSTEKNGFEDLSNFAERPFKSVVTTNGTFNTVEGAFQAAKFRYSSMGVGDRLTIILELMNTTGAKAKALGRTITGLDTKAWDENSSRIMKELLKESFEQNPNALAKLLATGNVTLTHTQDTTKWNKEFPKLLMEVRNELKPTAGEQVNNVEVVDRYSIADVQANPDKIYVFGDNTKRVGTGGQAQIRNNPNAMGIATKIAPSMDNAAFMSDKDLANNKTIIDSDIAKIKATGKVVVLPKDGFGTGLAKLKEKAPQTYAYLKQRLLEEFGFDNDTGNLSTQQPVKSAETIIKPTAESSISFLRKNADMSDAANLEAATQSALTETPVTFSEYQKLGGTISAEEFVSLSTAEKNTLVWQLKNCK